ncbi:putative fluoride ion transporter CrcB [compost metagenome]
MTPELRLLLAVGFCGGFTTFSTLSFEALTLLQRGHVGEALLYMGLSNALGLAAVALGWYLMRLFA